MNCVSVSWCDREVLGVGGPMERSKGGGPGEARAGGASSDTNSPVDCWCLASARCGSAGHERHRFPNAQGRCSADTQIQATEAHP